jgi:hypothetical protein
VPKWEDLPGDVLEDFEWLGDFQPTIGVDKGMLKGDLRECTGVYLEPKDLRSLASSCIIVAHWLEARKKELTC